MRIAYLCQFFLPEAHNSKIDSMLDGILADGHSLTVITGFPNYPGGKVHPGYRIRPFLRETIKGWDVRRLPLYPSHDTNSIGRILNYLSFLCSSLIYGIWTGRRYDVVYAYHPPITVGLAAALFGWVRRVPFVIDIQDLWPESVAASPMAGTKRLARVLQGLCDFTYRRASFVIVQCEGMRDRIIARGIDPAKVVIIYNWTNEGALDEPEPVPVPLFERPGSFNIVYGGNFGRAQSLQSVVEGVAAAAKIDPRIQLTLIGDGVEQDRIREHVAALGTTNIQVLPRMSASQIASVYARADALVVSLTDQPVFHYVIPTKTQAYLFASKPVVMSVGGDAATLIERAEAGVSVRPENAAAFADGCLRLAGMAPDVLQQMGQNGRRFYEEYHVIPRGNGRDARLAEARGA